MSKMPNFVSTTNACKLCKPLGATLAFRGIEGTVPFLHGSQGCATYMRRYIISHFNEPMDIASSSLGEKHAIFGGGPNLKQGIKNVTEKFHPQLIGIASTCLTETIGDDLPQLLNEYRAMTQGESGIPLLVSVSTPSYSGTHMEGFHAAIRELVKALTKETEERTNELAILPGLLSPEDIRSLKDISGRYKVPFTILPDISETLDGPALLEYEKIPRGGTTIQSIEKLGSSAAVIELGWTIAESDSAGLLLKENFGLEHHRLGMPIGLRETDKFFKTLNHITGQSTPAVYENQRGRLIDSLADGHKYVFGKRAIVYGEEDLVIGLTSFLAEIGVQPVLCASGGKSGKLEAAIKEVCKGLVSETPEIAEGMDFYEIEKLAAELKPDILIGHSKGYQVARKNNIPIVRVGFPVHDRIGGQRILHIGYQGAQQLFDTIANTLLEKKQRESETGYSYM
ncbi:MAG: nitrogenase [Nitrospira sp.]|nr:nitrogenase [bacterium]MBL7048621.1 nitrogenase [Nitrospira sp.]